MDQSNNKNGVFSASGLAPSSYENTFAGSVVETTARRPFEYGAQAGWNAWLGLGNHDGQPNEIVVNEKSAMGYAPLFRAWSILSGYVGKLPLRLWEDKDGPGRKMAKSHPAHKLLGFRPSSWVNALTFRETLEFHRGKRGNGYAYIFREQGPGTRPDGLTILDPRKTYPVVELVRRSDRKSLEEFMRDAQPSQSDLYQFLKACDATLLYVTEVATGRAGPKITRKIPHKDMFHVKGVGDDGLVGYDPVQLFEKEIGLGIGTRDFQYDFVKNGMTGGGVLMFKKGLHPAKQKETMRYWDEIRTGLSAWHRVAMLGDDTQFVDSGVSPKDGQSVETREFQISMASDITGVPPHKLGGKRITGYKSVEEENRSFLNDSLDLVLCKWECEADAKMLTEEEQIGEEMGFEFNRSKLQQPSFIELVEGTAQAVNGGLLDTNEGRKEIGWAPSTSPNADRLRLPLNIGFLDAAQDLTPEQLQAVENLVITNSTLALNRVGRAATNAAKDPKSFRAFLLKLPDAHQAKVAQYMEPVNQLLVASGLQPIPCLFDQMKTYFESEYDGVSPEKFTEHVSGLALSMQSDWPAQLAKVKPQKKEPANG